MSVRKSLATLLIAALVLPIGAAAQDEEEPVRTLFTNVMVWDGLAEGLTSADVLVEDNMIVGVGSGLSSSGATVVDGGGRTLMPGLIDMHAHMCIYNGLSYFRDPYDAQTVGAYTHKTGLDYLQQGFTTTRSAGCNDLGIAKAINNGLLDGPRWFPAGGFLSQTGGHADLGVWSDAPGEQDPLERAEMMYIVDGKTEARRAARSNFRRGATHIKIMGGGGVSSEFDPLHITQFSVEEFETIVAVAEDYGTYVTVHAYHDQSINRAIDAGVRMIEHGFLMSEETMDRMVAEGIVLSVQAQASLETFGNVEAIDFFTADQKAKGAAVNTGATQMLTWAVEKGVEMVLGGDMFGPDHNRQADNLTWFNTIADDNLLALRASTSTSGRVLEEMSGG
jgi:imidazolonepropionase-like amidohydrolase